MIGFSDFVSFFELSFMVLLDCMISSHCHCTLIFKIHDFRLFQLTIQAAFA